MDLADRFAVESSGKGHPCGHGCGYLPARDWKAPPRRRIKSACGLEKSPALADAVRWDRTWLHDFEDDQVRVSNDLYEVISSFTRLRPSAEWRL